MHENVFNLQKEGWNKIYSRCDAIKYDDWLENKLNDGVARNSGAALDVGCGSGGSIEVLREHGFVVSCFDYSKNAVDYVRSRYNVNGTVADMSMAWPYDEGEFDLIVSDLSIHYFNEEKTRRILSELARVMKTDGIGYIRVNSTDDINYGFGVGVEVEHNLFLNENKMKRFFDRCDIDRYFGERFDDVDCRQSSTTRFGKIKHVWEITIKLPNQR